MSLISKNHLSLILQSIKKLLSGKADRSEVEAVQLYMDSKADRSEIESIQLSVDLKADKSEVETSLGLKADKSDVETKMDKTNPTGTGSFSLNRKSATQVGEYSFAEGHNTTASGKYSHAEGGSTTASNNYSHAEGSNSKASGHSSHAEGSSTTASGYYSHTEGNGTSASGQASHAEGYSTKANGDYSHVQGKCNIIDSANKYAHIVGNGDSNTARSNAHTVDWDGLGWFAGGLKVGGDGQDDEAAQEVATKDYVVELVGDTSVSEQITAALANVGGVSRTLLWENENMDVGFGTNDNQDTNMTAWEMRELVDYDGYEILFTTNGRDDIHSTGFMPFSAIYDGSLQSYSDLGDILYYRRYRIRKLLKSMLSNIIDDNYVGEDYTTCLVVFERGRQNIHNPTFSSETINTACIPWRIYGIKGVQ